MKGKFHLPSALAGACIALVFCICTYTIQVVYSGSKTSTSDEKNTEETNDDETTEDETKNYDTTIMTKEIELDSGEKFTFTAPSGFYSLTDQYLESLGSYYSSVNIATDSMYVVGDNRDQTLAETIINMDKMSDLPNVFSQLYGKEYSIEDIGKSTAYQYMKTGKIPEDAEEDYKIEEIDKFKVNDSTFTVYGVSFLQSYEDDDGKTQKLQTKEIDCFSDTDDTIEIILYQTEYNEEAAIKLLHQFCGVFTEE